MPEHVRVAYVVTSYTLPAQVLRLVTRLRAGSPSADILVHHDDRRCVLDRRALAAADARLLEPASAVEWGEFSQLAVVLRAFGWLLERSDFDWLVLLSGQDYPVRPLSAIERDLAASGYHGFIEARPVASPPLRSRSVEEFSGRYFYRYARVPERRALARLPALAARARPLLLARHLPAGPRIGRRCVRTPFSAGLRCHRGSDWFMLSRRCISAVDAFARERPDVLRHYRRTLIPTESFVQTVLANDPSLRLSGDMRRFMRWDPPPASRPRVLRGADVEPMLASGADFARKFDESVDAAVLDELDRVVHA